MPSKADDLASRLERFAVRIVKLTQMMAREPATDVIARQVVASGTGQASNYHAARRARSRREFIAKLGVAVEEADETERWLAIVRAGNLVKDAVGLEELDWLTKEAGELRAILVASVTTARRNYAMSRKTAQAFKSSKRSSDPEDSSSDP